MLLLKIIQIKMVTIVAVVVVAMVDTLLRLICKMHYSSYLNSDSSQIEYFELPIEEFAANSFTFRFCFS